jgi:general secretion pathway protein A
LPLRKSQREWACLSDTVKAVSPDDRRARQLSDDEAFLASLSDPAPPEDAPADQSPRLRPLLELFPPPTTPRRTFDLPSSAGQRSPATESDISPLVAESEPAAVGDRVFGASTDPRFFYHSAEHDRASQDLLNAIRRRERVVVLTAGPGAGKTTLCRAVMDEIDRRTLTSLVMEPFVSAEDLLKTVLLDFGVISRDDLTREPLASASSSELLVTLRTFLGTLAPLQAFAVVVVDEAQRVPMSVLEQLVELTQSTHADNSTGLLQLVLVGQPGLADTLRAPEHRHLAAKVSSRVAVGPLEADEIGEYINHRFRAAGEPPGAVLPFDEAACRRVHELSGGVPYLINVLCGRALNVASETSAPAITARDVDAAAAMHGMAAAPSRPLRSRTFLVAALLLLLFALGAAGAAYVFRDRVAALVGDWQSR